MDIDAGFLELVAVVRIERPVVVSIDIDTAGLAAQVLAQALATLHPQVLDAGPETPAAWPPTSSARVLAAVRGLNASTREHFTTMYFAAC